MKPGHEGCLEACGSLLPFNQCGVHFPRVCYFFLTRYSLATMNVDIQL
jgi:hypothetical protein